MTSTLFAGAKVFFEIRYRFFLVVLDLGADGLDNASPEGLGLFAGKDHPHPNDGLVGHLPLFIVGGLPLCIGEMEAL